MLSSQVSCAPGWGGGRQCEAGECGDTEGDLCGPPRGGSEVMRQDPAGVQDGSLGADKLSGVKGPVLKLRAPLCSSVLGFVQKLWLVVGIP